MAISWSMDAGDKATVDRKKRRAAGNRGPILLWRWIDLASSGLFIPDAPVGAGLIVASDALPLEDAYTAVGLDTITLLLGMMIDRPVADIVRPPLMTRNG